MCFSLRIYTVIVLILQNCLSYSIYMYVYPKKWEKEKKKWASINVNYMTEESDDVESGGSFWQHHLKWRCDSTYIGVFNLLNCYIMNKNSLTFSFK